MPGAATAPRNRCAISPLGPGSDAGAAFRTGTAAAGGSVQSPAPAARRQRAECPGRMQREAQKNQQQPRGRQILTDDQPARQVTTRAPGRTRNPGPCGGGNSDTAVCLYQARYVLRMLWRRLLPCPYIDESGVWRMLNVLQGRHHRLSRCTAYFDLLQHAIFFAV
jgi:hypothetical protein